MGKPVILLTGFGPFGDFPENPTQDIVEKLDMPANSEWVLEKRVLDASYRRATEDVVSFIDAVSPSAAILTGLAGNRHSISIERVAVNSRHADIPDIDGYLAFDEPASPGGPLALETTVPAKDILTRLVEKGIKADYSYSAGTYVCNYLLYRTLEKLAGTGVPCGFFHFPPYERNGVRIMDFETMITALGLIVETVADTLGG